MTDEAKSGVRGWVGSEVQVQVRHPFRDLLFGNPLTDYRDGKVTFEDAVLETLLRMADPCREVYGVLLEVTELGVTVNWETTSSGDAFQPLFFPWHVVHRINPRHR